MVDFTVGVTGLAALVVDFAADAADLVAAGFAAGVVEGVCALTETASVSARSGAMSFKSRSPYWFATKLRPVGSVKE
jgi:hypothetical protein